MPHDPPVLLEDIRHAAEQIARITAGRTLPDYQNDEFLRAAVERFFITIGEALTRLERVDRALTNRITDYRKIIGFRNVLVHGYEMIDHQIVWQAIETHLPLLEQEVQNLLATFGPP